MWIRPALAP